VSSRGADLRVGGGAGGFALAAEGAPGSIRVDAFDDRSNLTIAVSRPAAAAAGAAATKNNVGRVGGIFHAILPSKHQLVTYAM
jgi:hypothetical protein